MVGILEKFKEFEREKRRKSARDEKIYLLYQKHIGGNVRKIRREKNISTAFAAAFMGISIAQLQKYETGENRIDGAYLYMLSRILDVSADKFFEGLDLEKEGNDGIHSQLH